MVRTEETQTLLKQGPATPNESEFAIAGFKDGWRTGYWKGFFLGLPAGAIVLGIILAFT